MATYFLRVKHISRGTGARSTRAAAYRAGERIRDERTNEVYDFTHRRDVAYKEVALPQDLAGREDMAWSQSRVVLWNAMEHAGKRRNSRMAREWLLFLPPELKAQQRHRLASTFASELANRYRCAVDLTVHTPRPNADLRHHHAHLMMTTREVGPDGVGARTTLELGGRERRLRGLGPSKIEYFSLRARWAELTNEALREAGLEVRVDHRSYAERGINREPVPTIPEKVFYAERTGGPTVAGEAIRSRHRERVEARLKGGDDLARVVERQTRDLRERAREEFERRKSEVKQVRWGALTREERNELRRRQLADTRTQAKNVNPGRRALKRSGTEEQILREAIRRAKARVRSRERLLNHGEAIREQRRQWRRAHADEMNRKQREYRTLHAQRKADLLERMRSSPSAERVAGSSAQPGLAPANSRGVEGVAPDAGRNGSALQRSNDFGLEL